MAERNAKHNSETKGQVNQMDNSRRQYLVKIGKASYYRSYQSIDDAFKRAGLMGVD